MDGLSIKDGGSSLCVDNRGDCSNPSADKAAVDETIVYATKESLGDEWTNKKNSIDMDDGHRRSMKLSTDYLNDSSHQPPSIRNNSLGEFHHRASLIDGNDPLKDMEELSIEPNEFATIAVDDFKDGDHQKTPPIDLSTEKSSSIVGAAATGLTPPPPAKWSIIPGPTCVLNIIGNELCERFSYYGLRAILVLFFVERLHWSSAFAISVFSYSNAAAYFCPIFGGIISDTWLGKYRTIISFSIVYCFGSFALSLAAWRVEAWLTIVALGLIAIGTGGIKPCVSTFGADQFEQMKATKEVKAHALSTFFLAFYFAINVGSMLSMIITPLVRAYVSYAVAFAIPAALLVVALIIFWSARNKYIIQPPAGSALIDVVRVVYCAARPANKAAYRQRERIEGGENDLNNSWLDTARIEYSEEKVLNAKSLLNILPVFSTLILFFSLMEQQGSAWTLQAQQMNTFFLEPEQMSVVNPILVLLLIPIFDKIIYPSIEKYGIRLTALRRMGIGMIFASAAFIASAFLQRRIDNAPHKSESVFLQLPQILLMTVGEVLLSVTGLEFAYAEAPPSLKSTISALFLLTSAIGNLLTGVIYTSLAPHLSMPYLYFTFAALMFANFLLFLLIAKNFQKRKRNIPQQATHQQKNELEMQAMKKDIVEKSSNVQNEIKEMNASAGADGGTIGDGGDHSGGKAEDEPTAAAVTNDHHKDIGIRTDSLEYLREPRTHRPHTSGHHSFLEKAYGGFVHRSPNRPMRPLLHGDIHNHRTQSMSDLSTNQRHFQALVGNPDLL